MIRECSWWIYQGLRSKWECEGRRYPLEIKIQARNMGGFTRMEAEEIGPQVVSASLQSRFLRNPQHLLVEVKGESFYVSVDISGNVMLPEDSLGNTYRTNDFLDIPDFISRSDWVPRNLYGVFARDSYSALPQNTDQKP